MPWWKSKTPEQMLRENQRMLNRAMRDMDRERQRLESQEKKVVVDIKKQAKAGQMDSVKVMAKDLVRTRQNIKKFMMMKANLQGVSLKIATMKGQQSMATAMKGVTKAMGKMNKQMNLPALQKTMMEFEREMEKMDMKSEMMDEAMEDAMDDGDTEADTDALVQQVLAEIGIETAAAMETLPGVGTNVPGVQDANQAGPSAVAVDDDSIEARLANLRK